jgi:hypothetical protein
MQRPYHETTEHFFYGLRGEFIRPYLFSKAFAPVFS